MTLSILFWVLYVVAIVFGGYLQFNPPATTNPRFAIGFNVLYFVLLGILGWAVFGAAVHR